MLCQTVSTGYVAMTAKEGRSSAVGLYVTSFYIGGSVGAFLPGLAWASGGWPACVAMAIAMQADHGRDRRPVAWDAIDDSAINAAVPSTGNAMLSEDQPVSNSCARSTRRRCATCSRSSRRSGAAAGYTVRHLHCPFPDLPPMVGFAKTVTIKAKDKVPLGEAGYMQKRLDYLDYVAAAPRPSIVVIEDLDGEHVGYGAFWGEVQSNVHKALGCLGTITNGSIRDIPMIAPGFQMLAGSIAPSHAYVHVVDFGVPSDRPRHGGEERRPDPRRPPRRRGGAGRQDRRHEGGDRQAVRAGGAHHRRRARAGRDGREHQGGAEG